MIKENTVDEQKPQRVCGYLANEKMWQPKCVSIEEMTRRNLKKIESHYADKKNIWFRIKNWFLKLYLLNKKKKLEKQLKNEYIHIHDKNYCPDIKTPNCIVFPIEDIIKKN